MINIKVALMIVAVLCFGVSAVGITTPRVNLQSLGLMLWALSILIG